jgi:hypothetical protein
MRRLVSALQISRGRESETQLASYKLLELLFVMDKTLTGEIISWNMQVVKHLSWTK